jgi:hypothetical protein
MKDLSNSINYDNTISKLITTFAFIIRLVRLVQTHDEAKCLKAKDTTNNPFAQRTSVTAHAQQNGRQCACVKVTPTHQRVLQRCNGTQKLLNVFRYNHHLLLQVCFPLVIPLLNQQYTPLRPQVSDYSSLLFAVSLVQLFFVHNLLNAFLELFPDSFLVL